MIKAVLFDVDGVLLDSWEANFQFYRNLALHTGYPPPTRERHVETLHIPMWDKIKDITGLREEHEIKNIFDIAKSDAIPYDHSLLSLPKGAEETIATLGKEHRLGIVSSRIKERIFVYQNLKELSHHFSTVVGYEDTIEHKPHPEPLLYAAQQLDVDPSTCVYIGDGESDMIAARDAGMTGVLFSFSEPMNDSSHRSITSFSQLPDLIKRLSQNNL